MRLSQLVVDFKDIKELDINPLLVYEKGQGCRIVDARIILDSGPGRAGRAKPRVVL
jgi:succinyl-CoA synthetase beta subunit